MSGLLEAWKRRLEEADAEGPEGELLGDAILPYQPEERPAPPSAPEEGEEAAPKG